MGCIAVITVALLAAAVARRLHDRDRSGLWGLAPLPFLSFGLVGMHYLMTSFSGPQQPDLGAFFFLFLNNITYLAILVTLVVQLASRGTEGENRFGPSSPDPVTA